MWTLCDPEPFWDDERAISSVHKSVVGAVDAIENALPVVFSDRLDSSIFAVRLDGPLYVGRFE